MHGVVQNPQLAPKRFHNSLQPQAHAEHRNADFGVPALVCINKVDINPKRAAEVEAFCASRSIEVIGHIPFDNVVTEAMVQGQPVTAYTACPEPCLERSRRGGRRDGRVTKALRKVWQGVKTYLMLNEENEE